jgi:hypothetical protein
MTEANETTTTRTPWHLWVVGGLSLAWNAYGAYDYLMTQTGGDAYLRSMNMTEPQIAYFLAMPMWTHGAWAIGVWGAIGGSVLLLLRRKWALHAFVASLAGLLASLVYTFLLSDGGELMGQQASVMYVVITAACLFFVWYAWVVTKKGVLR